MSSSKNIERDGAAQRKAETQGAAAASGKPARQSDEVATELPESQRRLIIGIMMAGTTAACISQSMMIAALPTVMEQFQVSAALAQLVTTAYIFTLGLFSAFSAYLVSKFDAKHLFLIAMAGFTVGCVATVFAPNYYVLLASRLVQAIGAGITLPLIQVVALSIYPKSQYGRAMGLVGVIIGFAPAIGPTISGFIIDAWGWRAVFVILGCLALAVFALSVPLLPNAIHRNGENRRFDAPSSLLYVTGFVAVLAGTSLIEESGQVGFAAVCLVAGAVLLIVFARRQLAIENPLLKLRCFADRTFAVGTVLVLLGHVSFMSASIMVPLFVQDVQGFSATVSGLVILPGAILLGFLNPLTGRYLDYHGPRPLLVAGCVLLVAGTLGFVFCDAGTPAWVVTVLYGVRICGVACLMMPMTAYACKRLPMQDLAQGTAIITSLRQIFGSLASSALIAVMAAASANELGISAYGFGVSFTVLAVITLVASVVCFFLLPKEDIRS